MSLITLEYMWKPIVAAVTITMCAAFTPAYGMTSDFHSTDAQPIFDRAIEGSCVPSAATDILRSYRSTIVDAPTVEEAREIVLSQTSLAKRALDAASWLLPFSSSVREARDKIGTLERQVYAANTQSEIAREFSDIFATEPPSPERFGVLDPIDADSSSLTVLASNGLDDSAVSVSSSGGGGCNYTTGEIIIIILGFLFFIIPGIIFLIIFC